eukprot:ANDGO_00007.mRNA.1 hypothetical protein GUITHDRAFT_145734
MPKYDDEYKNLIGSRRSMPSAQHNPLLVAAPVGAPKTRGHVIANKESRTYGKPNIPDKFHASDCINGWDFGKLSSEDNSALGRDYIRLNKLALHERALSAADQARFREAHPNVVRHPVSHLANHSNDSNGISSSRTSGGSVRGGDSAHHSSSHSPLPSDKDPSFRYGMSNRPSTPMKDVVEAGYQLDWVQSQISQQERSLAAQEGSLKKRSAETRAERMRRVAAEEAKKEQERKEARDKFKMRKFENVASKIHA